MQTRILDRSRPAVSILDFPRERIISHAREKLAARGVREAYIFGSFAQNTCTAWSDLDLVAVVETDQPFIDRPSRFSDLFDLGIPIDLLVYTPAEFATLTRNGSSFWRQFDRQKVRIL